MSSFVSSVFSSGSPQCDFQCRQLQCQSIYGSFSIPSSATVAQATSRATAITTTAQKGKFSLFSAANVASAQEVVINNALCSANSVVCVAQVSGTDKFLLQVVATAAGSFTLRYTSSGTTTEAPVFSYIIF